MRLTFKYDHDNDGMHVMQGSDEVLYITEDQLGPLLKCLAVDRVKEMWANNKQITQFMQQIAKTVQCDKCSGTGKVMVSSKKKSK